MKSLLSPTISCFQLLINKYCEISDEEEKIIYARCLNTAMSLSSRASKGFTNQIKIKDCNCAEIFLEILRIFIPVSKYNDTFKNICNLDNYCIFYYIFE